MRLRIQSTDPKRIDISMAPMIAVVFLLLIFFVLNLKIIASEKGFTINLPIGAPRVVSAEHYLSEIKVGLRSDHYGNLTQVTLGSKNLGNDVAAFERLNQEILAIIGRPGNPLSKDVEVEIDADYETQFRYVVLAVSKCTGRLDPVTKQVTRYIEKIKFAAPHRPKA